MTHESLTLTRRAALRNAAMLVGGAISAAELGLLETALAATDDDSRSGFLSVDQLSMVERIAEVIVPETDTPGAVSAGAHRFIDTMLAEWASSDTQQEFSSGLAAIDAQAAERGASFLDSSSEQQVAIVTELDGEAFAPGATDSFFRRLKKLVLFAYFSSEPGATEAMRFDRIPGDYDPCLSLEGDGRAWFWLGYSYDL
ncbi:MAG: gluconate 2-dehydrogenase subunit 3 family protein [Pseudomonadota bacterium]